MNYNNNNIIFHIQIQNDAKYENVIMTCKKNQFTFFPFIYGFT